MEQVQKVTLNRGNLLTGGALKLVGYSTLYEPVSGLQCCMGQYLSACGVDKKDMCDISYPSGARHSRPRARSKWIEDVELKIATLNDEFKGHQIRREQAIAKAFKEHGNVEITFTGSYKDAVKAAKAVA